MPEDNGPEEFEEYGDYGPIEYDEPEEPQPKAARQEEYLPFDLAQARPSAFDPVGEEDEREDTRLRDDEGNLLPEFDPRFREDFHGLAFIGALSKQFEWLGHRFVIRTLSTDEMLAVALVTARWEPTIGAPLAYKTAIAALCTASIDDDDLPNPIGADSDDFAWAFQRFNYAKARWFQFTVDRIYSEYLELEERTAKVVDAMGKVSTPTDSTPGLNTNSASSSAGG